MTPATVINARVEVAAVAAAPLSFEAELNQLHLSVVHGQNCIESLSRPLGWKVVHKVPSLLAMSHFSSG